MKKLLSNIKDYLGLLALILVISIWLWLPPLLAQLTYSDWTCAYKKCVVIKEQDNAKDQRNNS